MVREGNPRRVVARLVALAMVSTLAAGCGQYGGVHNAGSGGGDIQLAAAQQSGAPVDTDPARLPKNPDVVGFAVELNRDGGQDPGKPKGDRPSGRPGHGDKGRGGTPGGVKPRVRPSPFSTNGLSPRAAAALSRAFQRIAARNSNVLPSWFPLLECPVMGGYSYSDDYGAPRYAGGYHPHAGNDIFARIGTPVVAPFDGLAVKDPNTLGGLAVKVYGALGYVYMAHLVAYGQTGRVPAGTVVGFVGNTGDAQGTSPHDHFEWHPYQPMSTDRIISGTGGAVDPFPYLFVVCPPGPH